MVRRLSCKRFLHGEAIPLSPRVRYWCAGTGLTLAVLLAIAACLTPAGQGLGTHEQLGLPRCAFLAQWQVRCPSCGMTTAWAHTVRGRIDRALAANVAGTLLALAAVAAVPAALLAACRGRGTNLLVRSDVWLFAAVAWLAVMVADWLVRLVAG